MDVAGIEQHLKTIQHGVQDLEDVDAIVASIDEFQQDPLVLDLILPQTIKQLTDAYFEKDLSDQKQTCLIFYTFSKVCGIKKLMRCLDADLRQLDALRTVLGSIDATQEWQQGFFLLTWMALILMSPVKLDDDLIILEETNAFKSSQFLRVPLVRVKAELFLKNRSLFDLHVKKHGLDHLTIHYVLQALKKRNDHQAATYFDNETLTDITQFSLEAFEEVGLDEKKMILKSLPKLCKIWFHKDCFDEVESILTWFLSNLTLSSSDLRFTVANACSKVISQLHIFARESSDNLINEMVSDVDNQVRSNDSEFIDHDYLHTNLLVFAELARLNIIPADNIGTIVESIVPVTMKFQQLKIGRVVGHQIRDATSYISWSLIRKCKIENHSQSLLLQLLICTFVDKELVIRLSSNAALQELFGRYGQHVIDSVSAVEIIEMPVENIRVCILKNIPRLFSIFEINFSSLNDSILSHLYTEVVAKSNELIVVELTIKMMSELAGDALRGTVKRILINAAKDFSVSKLRVLNSRLCYGFLLLSIESISFFEVPIVKAQCFNIFKEIVLPKLKSSSSWSPLEGVSFLKFCDLMSKTSDPDCQLKKFHIALLFKILRFRWRQGPFHSQARSLCLAIIARIVSSEKDMDISAKQEFDLLFRKFTENSDPICCAALVSLSPDKFLDRFRNLCPTISCGAKAEVLLALSSHISKVPVQDRGPLIIMVSDFMNDYTTTEKGDEGRLVRTSAVDLVSKNIALVFGHDPMVTRNLESRLMRLAGEPATNLRVLSLSILSNAHVYLPDCLHGNHDLQLLLFNDRIFEQVPNEMWKGFALSAGASFSSDNQIRSAIDAFLKYYESLPDSNKLEVCNELTRIIPSYNELRAYSARGTAANHWSCSSRDPLKEALAGLTFWRRLMESGIVMPPLFNLEGMYAKFYNLHLVPGQTRLKTAVVRILPLLVCCYRGFTISPQDPFVKDATQKLWKMANRNPHGKLSSGCLQRAAVEGLLLIFLQLNMIFEAECVQKYWDSDQHPLIELKDLIASK
ncbi:LAMI_0F05666g1_1 [Lachancea mirantina]|uniref:LAMI_0F05666g1_1 n=1 Tax=Lachancea mirantina TaxID=1230905 RepID=A0A1G4JYG5_9SACH|nr:LAMI_0F05666g1_1 [Lachancea mirantina]